MPELSNRLSAWLIAEESSYGTDQVNVELDADNAVTWQQFNTDSDIQPSSPFVVQDIARPYFDPTKKGLVKQNMAVNINFPFTGKESAAGDPPHYAALLKAANLAETINVSTSAVYNLSARRQAGMTAYKYLCDLDDTNERLIWAAGVIGNLSITGTAAGELVGNFSGQSSSWTDMSNDLAFIDSSGNPVLLKDESTASLSTATKAVKPPMRGYGWTITLGGVTYRLTTFTIDLGLTTSLKEVLNNSGNTVASVFNTEAAPKCTGTLADGDAAYDNLISNLASAGEQALSIAATDGTDVITIAAPKAQLAAHQAPADVSGMRGWSFDLDLNVDDADIGEDCVTITYT